VSLVLAICAVAFADPLAPAYQINGRNNCWWTCGKKTGACPKTCGVGGYCCRRGWAGCNLYLSGVAPVNYHTCVRHYTAYRVNNLNNCWWTCGKKQVFAQKLAVMVDTVVDVGGQVAMQVWVMSLHLIFIPVSNIEELYPLQYH